MKLILNIEGSVKIFVYHSSLEFNLLKKTSTEKILKNIWKVLLKNSL